MNFEKFKSFNLSEFDSPNPIDRKRNRLFSLKSVLMTHRNDVIIRVIHVIFILSVTMIISDRFYVDPKNLSP